MKRLAIFSAIVATLYTSVPAQADDVELACEAVLCLSSSTRPNKCVPSIQRYFNINMKKFSDTLKARKNFLNLCTAASQDENMVKLVDAITTAPAVVITPP